MTDNYTPADALASIQGQRDKLAQDAASPPGYHVMLALIVGALIASPFFANWFILIGTYVLAVLCTLALVQYYKRCKGMWINGNADRPAKKNASAAGLIAGGGFAASFALSFGAGAPVISLILAALSVPAVTWLGYRWDAAYEQELRAAA